LGWKLRNSASAFKKWDYINEKGFHTFYGSAELAVRQTEEAGLRLAEMKGLSRLGGGRLDRYFSPYIHYVFTKPDQVGRARAG
jgi:hypothetical protein